jgi:hypothetical protein
LWWRLICFFAPPAKRNNDEIHEKGPGSVSERNKPCTKRLLKVDRSFLIFSFFCPRNPVWPPGRRESI